MAAAGTDSHQHRPAWPASPAALAACAATKQRPSGGADAAAGTGAVAGSSGGARDGGGGSSGTIGSGNTDGPGRVIGADALGDAACADRTPQKAEQVPARHLRDDGQLRDRCWSSCPRPARRRSGTRRARSADCLPPGPAVRRDRASASSTSRCSSPDVPPRPARPPAQCARLRSLRHLPDVQHDPDGHRPCASNADCRGGGGTCVRLGRVRRRRAATAPRRDGVACSATVNDDCLAIAGYCLARDKCDAASLRRARGRGGPRCPARPPRSPAR